jgi:hypothetical protein
MRDRTLRVLLDRRDGLAEAERDSQVAQLILERFDDFTVAEFENVAAPFDDGDLRAERGEHRRVLDADDTRADHDHRLWDLRQVEDAVGIDDRLVVELDRRGSRRLGSGRDDDLVRRRDAVLPGSVLDFDGVGICEMSLTGQQRHVVAGKLAADHVDLSTHHMIRACHQVFFGDVFLDFVSRAVHFTLTHAGEVDNRFAQRFRRNCAGVDADAADHVSQFDDGDLLVQFRRRNRCSLSAGPGAHHQYVEVTHRSIVARTGSHRSDLGCNGP